MKQQRINRNNSGKRKIQGKIDFTYNIFDDYYVIKNASPDPGFKVAWLLNKNLKTDFRKFPELIIEDDKQNTKTSYQVYKTTIIGLNYFLIYLEPEHLTHITPYNTDFFILIDKKAHFHQIQLFINKMWSFNIFFSIEIINNNENKINDAIPKQLQIILNNIGMQLEQYLLNLRQNKTNSEK